MWVRSCVHTKRVVFAGSSVKPQSGQGAESDRIATSFRPGACASLGLWLRDKRGSGRSSRDANGGSLPPKMSILPTAMREAREGEKTKGAAC